MTEAADRLKQATGSLGGDQDEKFMPWDMPSDEKNLYGRIAAKAPEERSPVEAFGKRYADTCFDLIQTRDQLVAALAQKTRECESLKRWLADETAIVDRIWDIYGRPSYEKLAGRTIYDLINADRAQVEQLERQVAELKDELLEMGEGRE